ncbi:MAG: hypothetical protein ABWY11_16600 [Umezawaea sp.]
MTDPTALDAEARRLVERLLAKRWQGEVRVGSVDALREGKVHRLRIADAPLGSPSTVIVKTAVPEPGIAVDPDSRGRQPRPAAGPVTSSSTRSCRTKGWSRRSSAATATGACSSWRTSERGPRWWRR